MVLEVAVSETQRKPHRDVDLWLDPITGNANVVIAIKVNRQRPMISIDKWVWDHLNGISLTPQHIEVSESETDRGQTVRGSTCHSLSTLFPTKSSKAKRNRRDNR